MLNSVEMALHGFNRVAGVVLVVGMSFISDRAVSGEERSHPSLVDPAITKCAVCHRDVSSTHSASASGQACLSCHTFETRAEKTFLVVEERPPSQDAGEEQIEVDTSVGSVERGQEDIPVPLGVAGTESESPPVETIYEIAPVRPSPATAALSETSPSEEQGPAIVSGDEDPTGRLYAEGMAAFNRGDFDRAFQTWRSMLADKTDYHVVQIEVDTYLESAQLTVATYGDHSLYVLKKDDLYWVFSGVFATRARAFEALRLLPEPLRQGGAFPIAVRQILPRQ